MNSIRIPVGELITEYAGSANNAALRMDLIYMVWEDYACDDTMLRYYMERCVITLKTIKNEYLLNDCYVTIRLWTNYSKNNAKFVTMYIRDIESNDNVISILENQVTDKITVWKYKENRFEKEVSSIAAAMDDEMIKNKEIEDVEDYEYDDDEYEDEYEDGEDIEDEPDNEENKFDYV